MPARENKKTSIAIDFERELKRSPFNSEIFVNSPSLDLKLRITVNMPKIVMRYIIK